MMRRAVWPWLWFGVVAVLVLSLLWRATEPASPLPARVTIPAPIVVAATPVSDTPLLLTALANLPGGDGRPVVVQLAPTPTETPFPRRATETPWPVCPQTSVPCEWPESTPTWSFEPTPTPLPICETPIPGDRCRPATPEGG